MLGWLRLLVVCCITFWGILAAPLAAMPSLPVVELEAGKDGPFLGRYIRYSKDIGPPSVPIERILELELRPNTNGAEHFGAPGNRTVLALKTTNIGSEAGTWILTTGRGSLSHFRLYELRDESFHLLLDGSDPEIAQANLRTYQAFSHELTLDPGQTRTIVVDFLSDNSTYLPLKLETYGTFFQKRRANIALVSGVVLAIAVLVFINSMFFSITGHREFGWLALAQTFFAISTIHTEGYLTIFLLADSPLLSVAVEDAVKCGFTVSMAQFARTFLKTPVNFPRLDKALLGLILIGLTVATLQLGLKFYSPGFRVFLHGFSWVVTGSVALFLPVVGVLAVRHIGRQLWPLLVGWGSVAVFIVYGAIASMGVFDWLPINWHSIGPVGLFEVLMVTLALGLNLRKINDDRRKADAQFARSMAERVEISERAARIAQEREFALRAVEQQNALLHASGHDSRQVILALNSAVKTLQRHDETGVYRDLTAMLQSSADYLSEIASTTMSGATTVGRQTSFIALSAFQGDSLIEPLLMMFKGPFATKGLFLEADIDPGLTLISDRSLLMRAIANLLSNSLHHTSTGGARLSLVAEHDNAIIEVADTGSGMSAEVAERLMRDDGARMDSSNGTGSGFRSARQIVARLGGTLSVVSTGKAGTVVQIRLCCAFERVTHCDIAALAARLDGWDVADFDDPTRRHDALPDQDPARLIAATHDNSSLTRGRLSEIAAIMLIKPLVIEMADHPAMQQPVMEQALDQV